MAARNLFFSKDMAARNQGLCSVVAYVSGGEELDEAAGDRHQQPRPRAAGCVLLHHVMGSMADQEAVRCLGLRQWRLNTSCAYAGVTCWEL